MSLTKTYNLLLLAALAILVPQSGQAQINVITNRYDNSRTGANLHETVLSQANVNAVQFGRLYSYPVDGAIYAQPLYLSNVSIAGGTHNVVYVATMNDKVYAFDADVAGQPLWTRDFTNVNNGITAVPISDITGSNSLNIVGNVGVESTPAIDLSSQTLYLVARTKENGNYFQRLHALDVTTGLEKAGSPIAISATVTGPISFDPKMQNQRAGLALTNGVVLVAWASHEDINPYHGWIMGYDAVTLRQVGVFCTTPNGSQGGIWQGGRAPVIDSAGYAYYQTGNGDWDGVTKFGESFLKFSVSSQGLSLVDWFTPYNYSALNSLDVDLGSSGPMLIPNTNTIVGGGKESVLYVLNTANLGHEQNGNTQITQSFALNGGEIKGGPAFWNGPAGGLAYVWAQSDTLKAFHFNGTQFDPVVFAAGTVVSPGSPGGTLSVSSNGSLSGTGLVWAELSTSQDGDHGNVAGILRAFNAETLQELWNSELSPLRDRLGTLVKYVAPLVVNGRVYAATYDNALAVYGLLPSVTTSPDFSLGISSGVRMAVGATASYPVNVVALNGFAGTVSLTITGVPAGATATFNPPSVSGAGSSTLQILTSSATAAGTYTLTVTGTSGTLQHSATTSLTLDPLTSSPATVVSIDFVGNDTPMAPTEIAGVVAKGNWNAASGAAHSTPMALVDENGASTGATVTWQADNGWSLVTADTAGNFRMMKGYLDTGNENPSVVTVANLPVSATGYDVYVYTDGDNGAATRTGSYQISGAGITTTAITAIDAANANFSGAFTQANNTAGNYVKFSINATAFTLTALPGTTTDNLKRAPVNGIQIVPTVPPPSPDFTVSIGSATQTISAGATATYPVNVAVVNGFAGTVSLAVSGLPAGATATFNPPSVSAPGSSTLQVSTSSATVAGTYPLTVTGTSGTLAHSSTISLAVVSSANTSAKVISIDFVGSDTPMASTEMAGVVAKGNWNAALGATHSTPLTLFDENAASTGATVTWQGDNGWSLLITDTPGNFRMMKGYLDTGNQNPSVVTVSNLPVSASGYDVYVYTDGDNAAATRTGVYQISGAGITTTSISAVDAANTNFSGAFNQANNTAGNYVKFSINATAFTLTAIPGTTTDNLKRAPVNGIQIVPTVPPPSPDFTVSIGSATQTISAGGTASYPVNVAAVNGFAGTVSLAVNGLPAGVTATLNPSSVSGAGSSTLQVLTSSTTVAGTYTLTVTGTSGSLVHSTTGSLSIASGTSSSAKAISIDFVGNDTPMASAETAGVVAKANWNAAIGASHSTPLTLFDENGASTGATVTWQGDNGWSLLITDAPGNFRMMKGYLDTGSQNPTVVTVSNLPVSASGYDVYVYTDGDNAAAARTGIYQISGAGITTTTINAIDAANANFSGAFTQANNTAGNYVKFSINATAFTLTAIPGTTTDNLKRAPVNGIQIVPTVPGS